MEQLDESSDGRELELSVGQEFELHLNENPTTGFRWRVSADGAPACLLIKDEFHAPAENRPGQGGRHVWQFRAAQSGQSQIALAYARAGGNATRSFTLRLSVK
jgi:inhibitor of cysteine peptidase